MTSFEAKVWRPSGRVLVFVLSAAILAWIDGQYLATHLLPSFIWQLLIRPVLFLGAILCLAALYVEGAIPLGPWGRARWRTGFRVALLSVLAMGLGGELLHALEPLQPDTVTITWGDAENGTDTAASRTHASGFLTYPVFTDGIEIVASAAALFLTFSLAAIFVLAIFAPACAMRSGWHGIIRRSWRAIRKHWVAIGIRTLAVIPVAFISIPVMAYWQVGDWTLRYDTPPEKLGQMRLAIDMCERVGVEGIALSAFASTAFFGLFLWWLGRSTGVLLDSRE